MIKRIIALCLSSAAVTLSLGWPAQAQEFEGTCELHYRDTVIGRGNCTANQVDDTVTVKGLIEENGERYTAIINNRSNYGTLLGAGTFVLAEGKLVSNDATRVIFPNHYELDIFVSDEEIVKGAAQQLINELFN